MITEILWWFFAIAIVGTAAGVVFSRSVVHAAIFLILSLAGVGGLYIFLTVEFVALVQFLIYGGAVTVLILLALMMTRLDATGAPDKLTGPQAPFGALVGITLLLTLVGVSLATAWPGDVDNLPTNITIEQIGDVMFTSYGAPFIIASALLLVAFIGAIVFAKQEDEV